MQVPPLKLKRVIEPWDSNSLGGLNLSQVLVVPSDGVFTRRHTAECAFCTVFYSVFSFSTMLPWGGRGAGTTVSSSDVFCLCPFALVFTVFFALSRSCFFAPSAFSLGFYSVFRLHDVAAAMLDICVGGDVNVPYNLK